MNLESTTDVENSFFANFYLRGYYMKAAKKTLKTFFRL